MLRTLDRKPRQARQLNSGRRLGSLCCLCSACRCWFLSCSRSDFPPALNLPAVASSLLRSISASSLSTCSSAKGSIIGQISIGQLPGHLSSSAIRLGGIPPNTARAGPTVSRRRPAFLSHLTTMIAPAGSPTCHRAFLWPFKMRRMAMIVFQFRVVAGTPYNLSIWPR